MVHVYSADSEDAEQTRSQCLAIQKHCDNALDFASTLQVLILGLNKKKATNPSFCFEKT